ncbi:MAG: hypothetical protein ACI9ON_002042 [Limisphaerales bacterium]|jgi:hypothetical protein
MSKRLSVHEDVDLGWCAVTSPNETVDAEGLPRYFDAHESDPRAPAERRYEHPEVQDLRHYLEANNGLTDLEICDPADLESIARIFQRDGFVVVKDLLSNAELNRFRDGCTSKLGELVDIPGTGGRKYVTETNRLPHRYSYGTSSASRQLLHEPIWASMVDLPTTTPILETLFGPKGYWVLGAGGDLCLPGAIEYQVLHTDFVTNYEVSEVRVEQARSLGVKPRYLENGEMDARSQQMVLLKTPPVITINFFMSDLTWENGPIRHIPGSHAMPFNPPGQLEEPEWMRLATMVGASAGAGIFRDSRAWHGATPNVSRQVRAMPNVEYAAPWTDDGLFLKTMPHEIWQGLSVHGQQICEKVVQPEGEWPAGAGVMHPLAHQRELAKTEQAD